MRSYDVLDYMEKRMNREKIIVLGALMLSCFALTGCDALTDGSDALLVPKTYSPISDIPVPSEFTMDLEKSDHSNNGRVRTVKHTYAGDASIQRTISFYEKRMPEQRPKDPWRLVSKELSNGYNVLMYKNSREDCTVSIWRDGFVMKTTYIRVRIMPVTKE